MLNKHIHKILHEKVHKIIYIPNIAMFLNDEKLFEKELNNVSFSSLDQQKCR